MLVRRRFPAPAFTRPEPGTDSPTTPESTKALVATVWPMATLRVRVPPSKVTGPESVRPFSAPVVGKRESAATCTGLVSTAGSVGAMLDTLKLAPASTSVPTPSGPETVPVELVPTATLAPAARMVGPV